MNSFLRPITVNFALGVILAWYKTPIPLSLFLGAITLYCSFLLVIHKSRYLIFICGLSAILGYANVNIHELYSQKPELKPNSSIQVKGLVVEMPKEGSFGSHRLIIENSHLGRISLNLKAKSSLPSLGDNIEASGKISEIKSGRSSSFSEEKYLRSQNIKLKISSGEIIKIEEASSLKGKLLNFIGQIQLKLTSIHKLLLPKQQASLMQAMLIGRSTGSPIDQEIWTLGQNLGLAHIFAASALNLTAITFFLGYLLNLLKFPRTSKFIFLIFCTTFYAFMAGWVPSIARAWFMANTVLIGNLINRKTNLTNTLFLALLMSLFIDPNLVGDLGFQFSYLSTLGLLLWTKDLTKTMKFIPATWAEPFAVTMAAQALILPLQLYYFQNLPAYSLIANLIAVPLATFILIFGLVASLFSFFGSLGYLMASAFSFGASLNINLLLWWMQLLGNLPGANLKLEQISIGWMIWLYGFILAISFFKKYKLAKHALAASALSLSLFTYTNQSSNLTIQFISKRFYEATLITYAQNHKIVICNAGPSENLSQRLLNDLKNLSVKKVDWWIGNCLIPNGIEASRKLTLPENNQKKTIDLKANLKIHLGAKGALIEYKNFSGLILFQPAIEDNKTKAEFYSFIKFSYNSISSQKANWKQSPKAEFCIIPHTNKENRIEIETLLKTQCSLIKNHISSRKEKLITDGNFLKFEKS